tara:strand:- start:248 stop:508 length:261 start_codon:yes stop_codon:yes gene_type:complete
MTEFTQGIFEFLKKVVAGSSVMLAVVYTLGHIVIAMIVVSLMTGASIWEAGAVALVEPSINGVWFYFLHSIWKKMQDKKTVNSLKN